MPYIIILNQLDGVELVINALRDRASQRGCIASADLADGISQHAMYQDEAGKMTKLSEMTETVITTSNNTRPLRLVN